MTEETELVGYSPSLAVRSMRRSFVLAVGALFAICALFSWLSWKSSKAHEVLYLAATAELSGKSLDAYFRHYENSLAVLAGKLGSGTTNRNSWADLLGDLQMANPDLLNVALIRTDGQVLATTRGDTTGALPSLADDLSFQMGRSELFKGAAFDVGRPRNSPFFHEWILPLRYAVRDSRGRLWAIISVALSLARQQDFWIDLRLPDDTALGVIRDDGFLASRYPAPKAMDYDEAYGKPRNGKLFDYLRGNGFPEHGYTEGYNSVAMADYLFAFRRLPHYPLTVYVSTPITNVQAKWWAETRLAVILLVTLLGGGFAVLRWTTRNQRAWEVEKALNDARHVIELEQRVAERTIQLETANRRLAELSNTDGLTGLANRRRLDEVLMAEWARASRTRQPLAVFLLDVDHFKRFNDRYGHQAGDACLKEVARVLQENARRAGDVAARYGGEEFALVAADCDEGCAARLAEAVRAGIEELALPNDGVMGGYVTASIGVAVVVPAEGTDVSSLLSASDAALYDAKSLGRNRVCIGHRCRRETAVPA